MTRYRDFANAGVSQASLRKAKEREAIEQEQETQQALVRRSSALAALADHMAEQNAKMLEGLKTLQSRHAADPPGPVNYIQRNIDGVSSNRAILDPKEQALIARAEVMAAATASLGGTSGGAPVRFQQPMIPSRPKGTLGPGSRLKVETEEDLVNAALAEISHGETMTAFESKTRKAPPKNHHR